MVIIRISGGLGNQIYQYALYRTFQTLGIETKLSLDYFRDVSIMKAVPGHSAKYLLGEVFGNIKESFSTEEEDRVYHKFVKNSFLRFLGRKGFIKGLLIEDIQTEKTTYHPSVFSCKNGYIDGYWQSSKYSSDIIDDLKNELSFKKPLVGKNLEISNQIRNSNSVSVHVRRGDYLNTEYEMLKMPYYSKALELVKNKIDNPQFFIFSDDIEWCRNNLGIEGTYVNWNKGDNSYIDMQLMSLCKANIVANSTFSIWAATLNRNIQPLIIHPYKYLKSDFQKADRWSDDWIEIKYK